MTALDTSGRVLALPGAAHAAPAYCWTDLDPFTHGYIEAMARDPALSSGPRAFNYVSPAFGFSDLAPEALAAIMKDCAELALGAQDDREMGDHVWKFRQAGRWPTKWPPLTPVLGDGNKVRFQ